MGTLRCVLLCVIAVVLSEPLEGQAGNCASCDEIPGGEVCVFGVSAGYKGCTISLGHCVFHGGICPYTVLPGEVSAAGTVLGRIPKETPEQTAKVGQWSRSSEFEPRVVSADSWRTDCKGRVLSRSMAFSSAEVLRRRSKIILI